MSSSHRVVQGGEEKLPPTAHPEPTSGAGEQLVDYSIAGGAGILATCAVDGCLELLSATGGCPNHAVEGSYHVSCDRVPRPRVTLVRIRSVLGSQQ